MTRKIAITPEYEDKKGTFTQTGLLCCKILTASSYMLFLLFEGIYLTDQTVDLLCSDLYNTCSCSFSFRLGRSVSMVEQTRRAASPTRVATAVVAVSTRTWTISLFVQNHDSSDHLAKGFRNQRLALLEYPLFRIINHVIT